MPRCGAAGGLRSGRASRIVCTGSEEGVAPETRMIPMAAPVVPTETRYAVELGASDAAGVIASNAALGPKCEARGRIPFSRSCLLTTVISPPTKPPFPRQDENRSSVRTTTVVERPRRGWSGHPCDWKPATVRGLVGSGVAVAPKTVSVRVMSNIAPKNRRVSGS